MIAPPFFTISDIDLMAQAVEREYDPNNRDDRNLGEAIKTQLWSKTIYWHDEVCRRLPGFSGSKPKHWNQRARITSTTGHKVWGQKFKSYTWTRLYKSEHQDKDIFFTVGVDGAERALVYKLDYKYSDGYLSPEQRCICKAQIKNSPAAWVSIPENELADYDWSKLIDTTVEFIRRYESLYDQVVSEVYSARELRICRVAYNTEGWLFPSGVLGKSQDKKSFEFINGFGCDEWLCCKDRLIDGCHYAFLEPVRKQIKNQSAVLDVLLYTTDSETRDRYWVGKIKNCETVAPDRATEIWDYYQTQGWIAEMQQQIQSRGGKIDNFPDREHAADLFNICFRSDDLVLYDWTEAIPRSNPIYRCHRYVLLKNKSNYDEPGCDDVDTFDFDRHPASSVKQYSGVPHIYERKPKIVERHDLHEAICCGLHKHLAETEGYGCDRVKREVPAGYGGKRIDLVVKRAQKELVFYEVKTYPVARHSVREALGQILEYALWPNRDKAVKFVIVTQQAAYDAKMDTYMATLRRKLSIDIYLQYFDIEHQCLSPEI